MSSVKEGAARHDAWNPELWTQKCAAGMSLLANSLIYMLPPARNMYTTEELLGAEFSIQSTPKPYREDQQDHNS
jgi:hypothetical protein